MTLNVMQNKEPITMTNSFRNLQWAEAIFCLAGLFIALVDHAPLLQPVLPPALDVLSYVAVGLLVATFAGMGLYLPGLLVLLARGQCARTPQRLATVLLGLLICLFAAAWMLRLFAMVLVPHA